MTIRWSPDYRSRPQALAIPTCGACKRERYCVMCDDCFLAMVNDAISVERQRCAIIAERIGGEGWEIARKIRETPPAPPDLKMRDALDEIMGNQK